VTDALLVVLILLLGMALLAVELLVIPGFGVAGIAGLLIMLAGSGIAWWTMGAAWGGGTLMFSFAITILALWLLPKTGVGRRLVLKSSQSGQAAPDAGLARLVGLHGVAITPLRPSGTAEFGEERVDVVTDGVYVERGKQVRVVAVEGVRVVVEEVEEA